MKRILLVISILASFISLAIADSGIGAVNYGNAQTSETSSLSQTVNSIEQTTLGIHAAGGLATFGSGVQVSQVGRVDSDAKPATTETSSSTHNDASSFTNQPSESLPISGSSSSASTHNHSETNAGIPGSASVNHVFNGSDQGGSSTVNTIDVAGNVNSNNITSHNPIIAASQSILANGNANASGSQSGGANGSGLAGGLAGNIQYGHIVTIDSNLTTDSTSNTANVFPVATGAWSFVPGGFGN